VKDKINIGYNKGTLLYFSGDNLWNNGWMYIQQVRKYTHGVTILVHSAGFDVWYLWMVPMCSVYCWWPGCMAPVWRAIASSQNNPTRGLAAGWSFSTQSHPRAETRVCIHVKCSILSPI
jgi:hypothetical protein